MIRGDVYREARPRPAAAPLLQHERCSTEEGTPARSLRTSNSVDSFRNSPACSAAQADLPDMARFLESVRTRRNMSCGANAGLREYSNYRPRTGGR